MKQRQVIAFSIIAGWLISALAIVPIALTIVAEEHRSEFFWYRILWTEVLCFLVWGSASFYLFISVAQKDSVKRFGGIAPTVSIVTAGYAILSFSAMAIHAYGSGSDLASRIHWVLQISFFVVSALCVVFLSISRTAATSGLEFSSAKAATPKELCDFLAVCESSLRGPSSHKLKTSIKQLREAVTYSLNETLFLSELPAYQEFCREVTTFCSAVSNTPREGNEQEDKSNAWIETAAALSSKAKLISSKQVKR